MLRDHNHPGIGEGTGLILRNVDPEQLRSQIAEARAAGRTVYVVGRRHPMHELCNGPCCRNRSDA